MSPRVQNLQLEKLLSDKMTNLQRLMGLACVVQETISNAKQNSYGGMNYVYLKACQGIPGHCDLYLVCPLLPHPLFPIAYQCLPYHLAEFCY